MTVVRHALAIVLCVPIWALGLRSGGTVGDMAAGGAFVVLTALALLSLVGAGRLVLSLRQHRPPWLDE